MSDEESAQAEVEAMLDVEKRQEKARDKQLGIVSSTSKSLA